MPHQIGYARHSDDAGERCLAETIVGICLVLAGAAFHAIPYKHQVTAYGIGVFTYLDSVACVRLIIAVNLSLFWGVAGCATLVSIRAALAPLSLVVLLAICNACFVVPFARHRADIAELVSPAWFILIATSLFRMVMHLRSESRFGPRFATFRALPLLGLILVVSTLAQLASTPRLSRFLVGLSVSAAVPVHRTEMWHFAAVTVALAAGGWIAAQLMRRCVPGRISLLIGSAASICSALLTLEMLWTRGRDLFLSSFLIACGLIWAPAIWVIIVSAVWRITSLCRVTQTDRISV